MGGRGTAAAPVRLLFRLFASTFVGKGGDVAGGRKLLAALYISEVGEMGPTRKSCSVFLSCVMCVRSCPPLILGVGLVQVVSR